MSRGQDLEGAKVHFHKVFVHQDRFGSRASFLAPWTYRLAIAAVSVCSLNCSAVSGTSEDGGAVTELRPLAPRAAEWLPPAVPSVTAIAPAGRPVAGAQGPPAHPAPKTVVSLTFDDGFASQYGARYILAPHDMKATFFVSSERLGMRNYMTWEQLNDLAADGHEIGGHTRDHVDLTTVDEAEQRRQVCEDRLSLQARGFAVENFAYPFGAVDSGAAAVVKECGYRTGRAAGGLAGGLGCGADCRAMAESIPPADPYRTRTRQVRVDTKVADMQRWVTDAEANGGGWVQFPFHNICDACDSYAITESDFAALVDWLALRASSGTVVKTVEQALNGAMS